MRLEELKHFEKKNKEKSRYGCRNNGSEYRALRRLYLPIIRPSLAFAEQVV